MSRYATIKSDGQLDAEAQARREGRIYSHESADSYKAKDARATAKPESFGALLGWYKREWDAEFPSRITARGLYVGHISKAERASGRIVPPGQLGGSLLGSPAEAEPLRARFEALDDSKAATATDYDPKHDTWSVGAAPRFPILDALTRYARKAPLLSRYLEAVAYRGFDWRRVAEERLRVWDPDLGTFVPDDEHHYLLTFGAMMALWEVWSRGQVGAGRDVA